MEKKIQPISQVRLGEIFTLSDEGQQFSWGEGEVRIDRIHIPKEDIPGNRAMYELTLTDQGKTLKVYVDPQNSTTQAGRWTLIRAPGLSHPLGLSVIREQSKAVQPWPEIPAHDHLNAAAIEIAKQHLKSKNLNVDEFNIRVTAIEKGELARVYVDWKKRAARWRGGDGYSRELRIDLTQGKVVQEVWPQ